MTVYVKAAEIAAELKRRLSGILIANGAETNIGTKVFMGRRRIPADEETPCILVLEGGDTMDYSVGRRNGAQVKLTQEYVIDAFDSCDPDNPNDQAHAMIRDIKRAIFTGNRMLDGNVFAVEYRGRDIGPRPDGAPYVQVRVVIAITYAEDLANP